MQIIGHRGAKDELPENTLLGIEKAILAGAQGIEVDVHQTKDGELVLIHDATLDRTTNQTGRVADLTFEEIRRADAGQGEKVPTLEEVLTLTLDKSVHLFIESKILGIEKKICELIEKLNAYDHCTVICFNHFFVKQVKEIEPRISTGCLFAGAPIDPLAMLTNAKADLLVTHLLTLDPRVIEQCKKHNIPIAVWDVNSIEAMLYLKNFGIDYAITDVPKKMLDNLNTQ
ncbi:MAG: glycerophosphodiester phosphodiesterase family protein [Bdellovibrionales bacterium]